MSEVSDDSWDSFYNAQEDSLDNKITIEKFDVQKESIDLVVSFRFTNSVRNTYFSHPMIATFSISRTTQNFFNLSSFALSSTEDTMPAIGGLSPLRWGCITRFYESKSFTLFSYINSILYGFTSPQRIKEVWGVDFDVNQFIGPMCYVTGEPTFGKSVRCSVTSCEMHPNNAVEIGGLYYLPELVKQCGTCKKHSPNWVNRGSEIICGECHANV
jgi:hypothetical protein